MILLSPLLCLFSTYMLTTEKTHLQMEPESNKSDIILNDKQKHFLKLVLSSRNISSTAARNVTSAEYANCRLPSLHAAQ